MQPKFSYFIYASMNHDSVAQSSECHPITPY